MKRRLPYWIKQPFYLAIAMSIVFHFVWLAGSAFIENRPSPLRNQQKPMMARYVEIKKKRDKKLLPKKVKKSAAVKKKKPKKRLQKKSKSKPKQKKKSRKPKLKPKKKKSASKRLGGLLNKWERESQREKDKERESFQGVLKEGYLSEIKMLIQDSYSIPSTLSTGELKILRTKIELRIGKDGDAIGLKIVKASKNALFDQAVLKGAKSVVNFGPPPIGLRRDLARHGLVIEFCPLTCSP